MNTKNLAFNFKSICIFIAGLVGLWWFIFNCYPSLVNYYLILFEPGYTSSKDILAKGTYGDMYGALNTFFSGLAFLGLLITIFLQIFIHERETTLEKERLENEKKEMNEYHIQTRSEKMLYIIAVLNRIFKSNNLRIKDTKDWLTTNTKNNLIITPLSISSTLDSVNIISGKINQQEYYSTYREFKDDTLILDIFEFVDNIKTIRNKLDFDVNRLFEFYNEKEKELESSQQYIQRVVSSNSLFQELALKSNITNVNNKKTLSDFCLLFKKTLIEYQSSVQAEKTQSGLSDKIGAFLGLSELDLLIAEADKVIYVSNALQTTINTHFQIIEQTLGRLIEENNQFVGVLRRIELLFQIKK